jgi:hypothetical protein
MGSASSLLSYLTRSCLPRAYESLLASHLREPTCYILASL